MANKQAISSEKRPAILHRKAMHLLLLPLFLLHPNSKDSSYLFLLSSYQYLLDFKTLNLLHETSIIFLCPFIFNAIDNSTNIGAVASVIPCIITVL